MNTTGRTFSKNSHRGKIRIIGGQWRGRKIAVAEVAGLRPTADRLRETLFNWLVPFLPGARCLDLFAGSGVLGLEAISRGASECVLVERHPLALRALHDAVYMLKAENARIVAHDALHFLHQTTPLPFDIVFLDPPFASNLLPSVCQALDTDMWLQPHALIYIEMPHAALDTLDLPINWHVIRRHLSRDSAAWLVQKTPSL
jgi:16S rRNA (guanine966-N2)-methyltransferase